MALECALQSDRWDEVVHLPASNLSTDGMFVETPIALEPGEELIVSFTPPGAGEDEIVWAAARVVRSARLRRARELAQAPGMGLMFTYCSESHRRLLARSLYGVPPRLPLSRVPPPLPSRVSEPAPELCAPTPREALVPAVRPLAAIMVLGEAEPTHAVEITKGPAPEHALEAEVVLSHEEAPPLPSARATMQVMDEELDPVEQDRVPSRANNSAYATMQVLDDELVDANAP